jgi:hypothetical protein
MISGYLTGGFGPSSVVSSEVAVATTWNPVARFFAGLGFLRNFTFSLKPRFNLLFHSVAVPLARHQYRCLKFRHSI